MCSYFLFPTATSIEDLFPYPSSDPHSSSSDIMQNISERTCLLGECSAEQRHECLNRLRVYTANDPVNSDSPQEMDVKSTNQLNKEEYQTVHHLILLLLLLLSMFIVSYCSNCLLSFFFFFLICSLLSLKQDVVLRRACVVLWLSVYKACMLAETHFMLISCRLCCRLLCSEANQHNIIRAISSIISQ